ncbi:MAG: DUF6390 family protein [Acidimicrobiia bacterium]|nr:DUF6390 family protein [Acidimicrobiia bacterium]
MRRPEPGAAAGDDGAIRFARYAYPPNALGLCGPDDYGALLEYGAGGISDGGLQQLARCFEGAWPYLELIAGANGIDDPLDARVVEAYWTGNSLLAGVTPLVLGSSLEERFRGPAGRDWSRLAAAIPHAPLPHHGFHVFAVYPWTGLLRSGAAGEALRVLDRCRIRWGSVVSVESATAVVRSRPLRWDGCKLSLDASVPETAITADRGYGLAGPIAPGDHVALHWDWVCERLTPARLRWLRRLTASQLDLVNGRLAHSPAAAVLG